MTGLARRSLRLVAALLASIGSAACLDLSGTQLTSVTVSSDGSSFTFAGNSSSVEVDTTTLATESALYLQNNSLSSVPAELLSAMVAATVIDLSDNPLTALEAASFVDLPLLQEIRCTDTELAALPAGLIDNCSKLVNVSFTNSSIRVIKSKTIANCPSLEAIHMSNGNVTALYTDSLYSLANLHTLDLSYNSITTVPSSLMTLSESWKVLDFSHNQLATIPSGVQDAVAEGYISFDWNLIVEIDANAFSGASGINELRLASNAIFTVNSEAFSGMSSLKTLDLSDNVISVIDEDAFDDLDNLEVLLLGSNNIHRLTVSAFPKSLVSLELQHNRLDLLPDLPDGFEAPKLRYLNLSSNILWSIETNSKLKPYTELVVLDLSSNQLQNFTPTVFDPILSSIQVIHFDDNSITSIPRTTFVPLLERLLTNVSLDDNPGVGWTYDNGTYVTCPNGSVFERVAMASESSSVEATNLTLYGCIQCKAGTYHDNSTNTCRSCQEVSSRAFADEDGATYCSYCPYSSDLQPDREECLTFQCNTYCWFTLSFGISVPGLIFGSKFLLLVLAKTTKRSRRVNFKEREDMNEWRMGLVMHQLGETGPHDALLDDNDGDEDNNSGSGAALRIYDYPDETKDMVLETLQEHFELRKQKMRIKMSVHDLDEAMEWDDVEWQTFHMHRILSRNYHGEVFLGDYMGSQVVVKRMMTLRFEVRELAEAINDIELMLTFRHPNIVRGLGTMWRDPEHLCIISEYVKGGDLGSLLELEAMNARANTNGSGGMNDVESSFDLSTSPSNSFGAAGAGEGAGDEYPDERTLFSASYYSTTRLQMMLDVCVGLAYSHDLGFQHNDIRSRNVLVTESFRCKLNDFQHHSRTSKHSGMWVRLTPEALATSALASVVDGESVIIQSNDSDEEEENEVVMLEHANPEGVRFREPLMKAETDTSLRDSGPTLPLVAPEVLTAQRRPRHWASDMYSVGVLLLEIWCQPFVSFEIGPSPGNEKKRQAANTPHTPDENASAEDKAKDLRHHEQLQQQALDVIVKDHAGKLRHFIDTLRSAVLATVSDEASGNARSFRTTTTTSSSLTSVASPCSPQVVAKVLGAIEECLQGDSKKRPTAKGLAKLFQTLLDDARVH